MRSVGCPVAFITGAPEASVYESVISIIIVAATDWSPLIIHYGFGRQMFMYYMKKKLRKIQREPGRKWFASTLMPQKARKIVGPRVLPFRAFFSIGFPSNFHVFSLVF